MKKVRVNLRITADTLRVIGPDGEQLGIFTRELAFRKAREYELDLVEVAPNVVPPVCRIMDFSKYKYEQAKRDREIKKHQKQAQLKEIRIRPLIDPHDYETKLRHIKEFLEKKHKVRIRVPFKGREMSHSDMGKKLVEKLIKDIEPGGKIEKDMQFLGQSLILVIGPK